MSLGTVAGLWSYPIKSLQGHQRDEVAVGPHGILGDRRWALIDANGKLSSAKRYPRLLDATGQDDGSVLLPSGVTTRDNDAISEWIGAPMRIEEISAGTQVGFEMTFDPPNDDAEYIEWPAPEGTFFDLASIHLITTATLAHCAAARPDLDWDVRRFRPNLILDVDVAPFGEDAWVGQQVAIGNAVVTVDMPTVRCAMPLRAQPGGITRDVEIFRALNELHDNFLGLYCSIATPGAVRVGDSVSLVS